jgi:hypothetical protein
MFNRFHSWYIVQSNNIKFILTFSSTILSIYLIFLITLFLVIWMGKGVIAPLNNSDNSLTQAVTNFKKPDYLSTEQFQMFQTQYTIMNFRKRHHLDLALIFFRNYYSVLILTMFISCVGGIVLFVMINKGWATAGITLQSFFLALVLAITYLNLFPLVFKQQENFGENMKFYQDYTKSQLSLYNQLGIIQSPYFAKRADTIDKTKLTIRMVTDSILMFKTIDTMLVKNNNLINGLTNYVFTIDPKQLKSISDIYQTLSATALGKDTLKRN